MFEIVVHVIYLGGMNDINTHITQTELPASLPEAKIKIKNADYLTNKGSVITIPFLSCIFNTFWVASIITNSILMLKNKASGIINSNIKTVV